MSLIAEYRTFLTQLTEALTAVPEMTVRHEEIYFTPERRVKWIFWASGGDLSAFETALAADSSVERATTLTEVNGQRLFSATLRGDPEEFALSTFNEEDIQILDATHDHDETFVRVRCPSREAFVALKEAVESRYGKFVTERLYRGSQDRDDRFGVTPSQRKALLLALEAGYFHVPRRTTMVAMADELAISDQALSARIRRGQRNLLENTLGTDSTT